MTHHRTTSYRYIFATKACIDNRNKVVKQRYLLHMSWQYGELRPTSGWDRFDNLGHPSKFQRVSRLAFVTAATSLNWSQPNLCYTRNGITELSQRTPPIFGWAAITFCIGPHSSLYLNTVSNATLKDCRLVVYCRQTDAARNRTFSFRHWSTRLVHVHDIMQWFHHV